MKVMMIITGLGMGGAERIAVNLADELAKLGHSVMIAYLTGDAVVLPLHMNVHVVPIGMRGPKDCIKAYLQLKKLIDHFKPCVVHSHMVHANILSRLLRLSTHIPRLVCSAHSNNEGGCIRRLAYRLTDALADISTNVSDEAVAAFITQRAVRRGRMISVPNGIDTNKFKFDSVERERVRTELRVGQEHMLLAVGRLDTPKDYPNLLHAIALLKKQRQNFKIFIVGSGPLKAELEDLAAALDIGAHVNFLGVRHDVSSLMSAADIFVLSSAWEGFGLVVAEAMACERLVVATDCGGVREVLGEAGILIDPQNTKQLAGALLSCFELDLEQYSSYGRAARLRVLERYSLRFTVEKYLSIYIK